jgi:uncharacterized membrane protein YjfL (UPF0719 family)
MFETVRNIGWSMVFSFVGGLVGMALVLAASFLVPRLIDRLTPNIDEQREIARGNSAVAELLRYWAGSWLPFIKRLRVHASAHSSSWGRCV